MKCPQLRQACLLDAAGVIPGAGETCEAFFSRAQRSFDVQRQLFNALTLNGKEMIFDGIEIELDRKVDDALLENSRELTEKLYSFRVEHIPGFFLSGSVGPLWGGCLIGDPDLDLAVFFLRNAFKDREKWLFYNRTELGAHELCHSARVAVNDPELEEYFAYQTSSSKLRRYLGNCFIRDWDAILFVLPALLLPIAQFFQMMFYPRMWILPFWIIALIYPCYLLFRNQRARNKVSRARKVLLNCDVSKADAVLFRCTPGELEEIGRLSSREQLLQYVGERSENELRWQVIEKRFIMEEKSDGQTQSI
ncbi:MAG: hypothetical protein IKD29_10855 [Lentisphaeria bacterium]|nr:hypothetical protein [Lentisphaerota bacterium]MBR2633930.1 hypothetical protein [Lentisphaeria bacterium]